MLMVCLFSFWIRSSSPPHFWHKSYLKARFPIFTFPPSPEVTCFLKLTCIIPMRGFISLVYVAVCIYIFSIIGGLAAKSCPTLCNPMDCGPPGFSVHGISQARILKWVAISFFTGSSPPRDWTWVSCFTGRFFTNWATRAALSIFRCCQILLQSDCTNLYSSLTTFFPKYSIFSLILVYRNCLT